MARRAVTASFFILLHNMAQVVGVMATIMLVGPLADRILFSPIEGAPCRRPGLDR